MYQNRVNTSGTEQAVPAPASKPTGKMPTGYIVAIAVLALALVGALGYIVIDKMSEGQESVGGETGRPNTSETVEDGGVAETIPAGDGQVADDKKEGDTSNGGTSGINLATAKPVSNPDGNEYELLPDSTKAADCISAKGDGVYELNLEGDLAIEGYNKKAIRGTFKVANAKEVILAHFGPAPGAECILVLYNDGTVGYSRLEDFVESGEIVISRIPGVSNVEEFCGASVDYHDVVGGGPTIVAVRSDNTFYDLDEYIWK